MAAYSDEDKKRIVDEICNKISNGNSLRRSLIESEIAFETFYRWIDADESKSKQFNKAKESILYLKNIRCNSNPKKSKALDINDYRKENARKSNAIRFPNSKLYIFTIPELSLFKIGVSQNVDRRLRDLNNANPFDVKQIHVFEVKDAYDLELYIHRKFESSHLKNEWFLLNKNDVDDILLIIENKLELV